LDAQIPQLVAAQSALSSKTALIRHTIGQDRQMRVAGLLRAAAAPYLFSYAAAALTLALPGDPCS
jgi:hypothetical protein